MLEFSLNFQEAHTTGDLSNLWATTVTTLALLNLPVEDLNPPNTDLLLRCWSIVGVGIAYAPITAVPAVTESVYNLIDVTLGCVCTRHHIRDTTLARINFEEWAAALSIAGRFAQNILDDTRRIYI